MVDGDYEFCPNDMFEIFDVVSCRKGACCVPYCALSEQVVYVDKKRYDSEVSAGQESMLDAYAQLGRDIDRSIFYIDGRRTNRINGRVPLDLVRFCTQAVMAFPIEMLMKDSRVCVIADGGEAMTVHASTKEVRAHKKLRIFGSDGAIDVDIHVVAERDNPVASITYHFGVAKCNVGNFIL